jgi:hypothetical protein
LILFGVMGLLQVHTDITEWVWVVVLAAAGLGALGIYLADPCERTLLIPAYVLWAIAGLLALTELGVLRDESVATCILSAIALPFVVVFLRDRTHWWSLIPAYVLVAIGVMVWLIGLGVLYDLLVPTYVMLAVAVPFFVVCALNPKQWWPLIPDGVMAIIGCPFS